MEVKNANYFNLLQKCQEPGHGLRVFRNGCVLMLREYVGLLSSYCVYHHGLAGMLGAHPNRRMKWGIGRMSFLSPGHLVASLQHVGSRFQFQISLCNRVNRMWKQPPACCCESVPDLCVCEYQEF